MFGFLGAIGLPWKMGIAAAVLVSLLLWFRWQLNKAYEKGHVEGVANGIEQIEKQKAEEWRSKETEFAFRQQQLEDQSQVLAAERDLLNRSRLQVKTDFNAGIEKLRTDLHQRDADVVRIPSGELVAAIKIQLRALR